MNEIAAPVLEEPHRESSGALVIAGLRERYDLASIAGIPSQWARFLPYADAIPARAGGCWFGVCCGFDETGHYDYLCGVAVSRLGELPPELSVVRVPARNYLVFRHAGHVSMIPATWRAIMNDWLPASRHRPADAPSFELYAADFDGATGLGRVEIWIPVEAA